MIFTVVRKMRHGIAQSKKAAECSSTLTYVLCFQDDCVDGDDATMAMSSDREAEAPTHSCYGATGSYQCGTIHEGINQMTGHA